MASEAPSHPVDPLVFKDQRTLTNSTEGFLSVRLALGNVSISSIDFDLEATFIEFAPRSHTEDGPIDRFHLDFKPLPEDQIDFWNKPRTLQYDCRFDPNLDHWGLISSYTVSVTLVRLDGTSITSIITNPPEPQDILSRLDNIDSNNDILLQRGEGILHEVVEES